LYREVLKDEEERAQLAMATLGDPLPIQVPVSPALCRGQVRSFTLYLKTGVNFLSIEMILGVFFFQVFFKCSL
jgi:hypothetical protein